MRKQAPFLGPLAGILTASGVYDNASSARQASCRTDNMDALHSSPWVYVPYPLQWGMPIFKPAFVITMMAGALAAMIESVGGGAWGAAGWRPPSVHSCRRCKRGRAEAWDAGLGGSWSGGGVGGGAGRRGQQPGRRHAQGLAAHAREGQHTLQRSYRTCVASLY